MSYGAHDATRRFEEALYEYTGAPAAVAVSSCTAALELCLSLTRPGMVEIPKRTYVGVAQAAVRAGCKIRFKDEKWGGAYKLGNTSIWDAAKRFTAGMYMDLGGLVCLSFHAAKILGDTQGGAILCDAASVPLLRKMRFDGRTEGVPAPQDKDIILGQHCYMSSDVANRLHLRLTCHSFPRHNPDQCPEGFLDREYGDLSQLECFKPYTV